MQNEKTASTEDTALVVLAEETKFDDWQVQLRRACEADRLADIDAITSLRPPELVVLRHVTTVRDQPQAQVTGQTVVASGSSRRMISREEVVPFETVRTLPRCPPPPEFPQPGTEAAVEFLRHLLREPCEFRGRSLFWVQNLAALHLLEQKGANTRDLGWMGIPLLAHMAEQGRLPIVRFLVEERSHDPSVTRVDGQYAALHWARGLDVVRYLIERGANGKALTSFGDSIPAQQVRHGQVDVVNYLLGLGEERVSRANVLHWLWPHPEMLRVICRHLDAATLAKPIEPGLGESHAPLVLHRILERGIRGLGVDTEAKDVLECVDILLDHGFDPTLYDYSGRLPWHVVQDLLPETDDPLRHTLSARLAKYDGERKRPRRWRKR